MSVLINSKSFEDNFYGYSSKRPRALEEARTIAERFKIRFRSNFANKWNI